MSRAIDYITLTIIIFLLTLVWSSLVFSKWIFVILFASAVSLTAVFTMHYFGSRRAKPYSYDRLALELSVRGPKYLIDCIKSALKNGDFESGSNYILLDDCILVAAFKFSQLGAADLSNIFQLALQHEKTRVFVMARGIERRAYQALQFHEVKISLVKIRAIYHFLDKNKALPDLKPQKRRFSFAALGEAVFSRGNTKYYIFSGAILLAVAFLTPLKIYYLIFGSISLIMALLTFTPLGRGSFKSDKIFEKLGQSNKDHEEENASK